MSTIGINGFGPIGRQILRTAVERCVTVKAINDPWIDAPWIAYKLKYETSPGPFNGMVYPHEHSIVVNNQVIKVFNESSPESIKWDDEQVDYVVESSGRFTTIEKASAHLNSGAKKVIITEPSCDAPMFVSGVNWETYRPAMKIVSSASCTTHCVAPLIKLIHDNFEVVEALMTTVHSAPPNLKPRDTPPTGNYFRLTRSIGRNIIPGETGAAMALGKVIPALDGKITGMSLRIPKDNVSLADVTVRIDKPASMDVINETIKNASEEGIMRDIIGYSQEQLVSSDFIGNKHSAIYDSLASVALNDHFVKLIAWYDNQVPYVERVIDLIKYMHNQQQSCAF